jgi:hypothetical protein
MDDPQLQQVKNLMIQCGLSEEAAGKICESIVNSNTAYKAKIDEEYAARVEAARKICVEETEAHKLELARRLQIFLEAKSQQIEQLISRQVVVREGEATHLLSQVQSLLEGIPAGGDATLKTENDRLRQQLRKMQEERNQAVTKANRQTELAEKVLKRNRLTEARLAQLEQQVGGAPRSRQPVTEGTGQNGGPRSPRRLDSSRSNGGGGAAPHTTRTTLVENQDPAPPRDTRTSHLQAQAMPNGAITPAQIAEQMEDTP